jgi:hypothetical protein
VWELESGATIATFSCDASTQCCAGGVRRKPAADPRAEEHALHQAGAVGRACSTLARRRRQHRVPLEWAPPRHRPARDPPAAQGMGAVGVAQEVGETGTSVMPASRAARLICLPRVDRAHREDAILERYPD